jgi:hypothetical protein
MPNRIDRILQVERLLLDEARAAYAGAAAVEFDERRNATLAVERASGTETALAGAIPDSALISAEALQYRTLCAARLERELLAARRRLSRFAMAKAGAGKAREALIARDRRKKGVETIAAHRAAQIIKQIECQEEGGLDDLAGSVHRS